MRYPLFLLLPLLFVSGNGDPLDFDLQVVDGSYPGNGRPGWSAAGDLNNDGLVDVVSGGGSAIQWYVAPNWTRHAIENNSDVGGNGGVVADVDEDGDLDIVTALYLDDLVWFENPGGANAVQTWTRHTIDATSGLGFNHDLIAADIDGDGANEFVALYVATGGVVWYDVPANPKSSNAWPRVTILNTTDDPFVGLASGDLDQDGDIDVVVANRWYENENPNASNWTSRELFPDDVQNVFVYDVDQDGRNDVVGAQGFKSPGKVMWSRAPSTRAGQWDVTTVDTGLDGPENIWAGDLLSDGESDIVTGEMGTSNGFGDSGSNLVAYRSDNLAGSTWTREVLASNVGVSARINPIDVDGDGDVDFTADGNAEDHIYLWVNNSEVTSTGTESADVSREPDALLGVNVYPNPFVTKAKLRIRLGRPADVEISVFDALGRAVAGGVSTRYESGLHEVDIERGILARGVYFCQVSAAGVSITRTVVVAE